MSAFSPAISQRRASVVSVALGQLAAPAVVAIAVAIPLIVAVATGGISIPHVDDWSYYRSTASFTQSGHAKSGVNCWAK